MLVKVGHADTDHAREHDSGSAASNLERQADGSPLVHIQSVVMALGRLARWWFALTALVVAVGLVVQLVVVANGDGGFFTDRIDRVLNVFVFFTIQSNIIVGVTSLMLAARWARPTKLFRTLRLTGVIAIALTFVVFHAVLRELQDLTGQAAFADLLLHTVSPVLCVVGWLVFGPRAQTTRNVVVMTLTYLLAWGTFTLVRGEVVGFYPYPFMDPTEHGYVRVAINLVLIGVVFVAFAAGAHVLDLWLSRRHDRAGAPPRRHGHAAR